MSLLRPCSITLDRALRLWPAALLSMGLLVACGGSDDEQPPEPTPVGLALEKIGGYDGGAVGAAEITAYDAASKRLFVVNGANGTVDVLDLSAPATPRLIGTVSVSAQGAVWSACTRRRPCSCCRW